MRLTEQQERWLGGDAGASLQWAMRFNHDLGTFFGAEEMVQVASAHFAPDIRAGGAPCRRLLRRVADEGARIAVPGTLDPCMVDFTREAEWVSEYGVATEHIAQERETHMLCVKLGFRPTFTCINYQSLAPPAFGEHLAWGDTGAAVCANALFGARTNFEGGPSALASALTGCTPAYGLHLDAHRRGNLLIRLDCAPREIADWGAIARWSGSLATGYDTVPVFYGAFDAPDFDMLKQLGVALASYGGHAMFHVVGRTPEAGSPEQALGGRSGVAHHVMTRPDLDRVFDSASLSGSDVDLVVFAAPQLSIDELRRIARQLDGRRVHENTKLIIAVDPQVRKQADTEGVSTALLAAGAEYTTGTCFYPEAPWLTENNDWRSMVTNSAKLVNTVASVGIDGALRRLSPCLEAAVTGKLAA
ncbi:MAG: aconitase X [Pseudomonadota bacterium]